MTHDQRTPLEGPFRTRMAPLLALVGVEICSKKLNYQSGRPDLNRRPLDPQEVGFGVCPGQSCYAGGALGVPTCGLFSRAHTVWSQSGIAPCGLTCGARGGCPGRCCFGTSSRGVNAMAQEAGCCG